MVFVENEVDKRNKLYKKVKDNGYAAELKKQDADQLMRWAAGILSKDGKKITRQVMEYFMERTGDDMENIRMELEKLICYTMGREVITKEDVEAVGTVHVTNRIFEMVTAIVAGTTRKAMDLYAWLRIRVLVDFGGGSCEPRGSQSPRNHAPGSEVRPALGVGWSWVH